VVSLEECVHIQSVKNPRYQITLHFVPDSLLLWRKCLGKTNLNKVYHTLYIQTPEQFDGLYLLEMKPGFLRAVGDFSRFCRYQFIVGETVAVITIAQ